MKMRRVQLIFQQLLSDSSESKGGKRMGAHVFKIDLSNCSPFLTLNGLKSDTVKVLPPQHFSSFLFL